MENEMQGQGDTQIVDAIIAAVQQLMQAAGPEWTLEFIQAGMEEAAGGGQPAPEMMSRGGPSAMPPMRAGPTPPRNALAGQ